MRFLPADQPPEKCGAVHPRYPQITCERWGKCGDFLPDWHRGIATDPRKPHGYQRRWIEWEVEPQHQETKKGK